MDVGDKKYLLRFPPFRSQEWLEENKTLKAVEPSLCDVSIQPRGLLNYSHVKAYEIKANSVRKEIRNALFRQALFKIQNIEVISYKYCKNDRLLTDISKTDKPLHLLGFLRNKKDNPLLSEEIWTVDRCGAPQKYRVNSNTFKLKIVNRFLKKFLSNKGEDDSESFTSAHLGEENNFYYNEELKQWVVRGEEDKVRETLNTSPPPMMGKDLNFEPSVPPTVQTNANGTDGTEAHSPENQPFCQAGPNHLPRRVFKSSQLYTNIPGMNVIETKPAAGPFLNMPQSCQSQFIPSKDDFDASLVNDAYADLMKGNVTNDNMEDEKN
ncbi:uncharacterized protein TA04945 [Theileria annulata]|uniref:Uncharacterized protein n=1 Tax=Theileria annulata TaxID=5874 RepID=Q4UBS3_THEAN|nr:uncharacterized protein TA04945 [Theileria annulata]CAI75728.1 hypothetical protein TA04945 [Theileria annulata]|eukprot:XP_955204.1 hypothetical protein TA04945 [Theileria annulata]